VRKKVELRTYECECVECRNKTQIQFKNECKYPKLGEIFTSYCKCCGGMCDFTRTMTKKALSELRRIHEEQALKDKIQSLCDYYGYACKFVFQSVVITTPIASWSFDYHKSKVTLHHESSVKINWETGLYARTHVQFREKNMNFEEILAYIHSHDTWRKENSSK